MAFYTIYLSLITFLLLFNYFCKKHTIGIPLLVFIFVVVISAIRENVGYDYNAYKALYVHGSTGREEFGFVLVSKFLKFLGLDYHWLFIFFSLTTILFICKGIERYTRHCKIAFLIYFLIPGLYLNSFSILRQSIAIAILFYGYSFYLSKKWFRYFGLVLLAIAFHYSSLVALPFFLLSKKAIKMQWWMYCLVIILAMVLAKIDFFNKTMNTMFSWTKYFVYANRQGEETSFFKILVLNIFALILLLFYKNMSDMDRIFYFFVVLSVFMVTVFGSVVAVTRIGHYFRIFESILIADLIYRFRNKDFRLFVIILIIGYYGIMFYNALWIDIGLKYFPKITPYNTMFGEIL